MWKEKWRNPGVQLAAETGDVNKLTEITAQCCGALLLTGGILRQQKEQLDISEAAPRLEKSRHHLAGRTKEFWCPFIARPPVSSARPLAINHRCSQQIQHPSNSCLPLQPDMPDRMFNLSTGFIFHFPILETVHGQLLEKGRRSEDLDDGYLCPIQSDLFTNSGARQKQKDASFWHLPQLPPLSPQGIGLIGPVIFQQSKTIGRLLKVDALDFRPEISASQLPYEFYKQSNSTVETNTTLHFYRLNSRTWEAATQQHIKSSTAWWEMRCED